ncbi:MAG: hypothetical protein V3T47_03315 [Gammaproteobacteria bacterium]
MQIDDELDTASGTLFRVLCHEAIHHALQMGQIGRQRRHLRVTEANVRKLTNVTLRHIREKGVNEWW